MIFVLDACAMIAYLRNELGGAVVDALLGDPANTCYAHVVNLMEVYYDFLRTAGRRRADAAIGALVNAGVQPRRDIGTRFWKYVGTLKAAHRIAVGDCFCIALAQRLNAQAITSDHREFDPLVPLNLCPIRFIR